MKIVLSRARKAVVRGSACYPIIERRKKTEKKSRLQRAAGDFFLHPRPMKPTGSGGKLKQMVSTIHEPRHVVFALNKISHVRLFAKAHISGSLSLSSPGERAGERQLRIRCVSCVPRAHRFCVLLCRGTAARYEVRRAAIVRAEHCVVAKEPRASTETATLRAALIVIRVGFVPE